VFTNESFSLLSDANGRFTFARLPSGDYVLFIWWSPGFVGVPTSPTNSGLYWAGISVSEDGIVRGELPEQLMVKPNTAGVIPYPVRTGGDTLPVGTLQVGSSPPVEPGALPPTGGGNGQSWQLPAVGGVALLLAAISMAVLGWRRLGSRTRTR
jgi:hypothetical protein